MDSRARAKWLATVIASFPRRVRKISQSPKAGDYSGDGEPTRESIDLKGADLVKVTQVAEGIAVGSDREARAWIKEVLKERPRDADPSQVAPRDVSKKSQ